ncbi:alcohol dehydrogenase catalytic domain-containing protein [Isoptericola sp. S6320L]|uniref:zinc-binding dehydrogenase n=1 Tax=Isoptericola sp. S6320L TaxID=2926411 RepID=UPI001FF60538|nr:alcohol dehydrogenase catalytic domain-containing protein [Isoptericola sp. S6320L]MCK0117124.1 alcohol dehydrogenase catalytic domain-containing protein [Isoptericola sp. S6320L]
MRAIAFDRPGGPVTVRDLPAPAAPDGGVVIRVHATGLCLSDWHGWAGHDPDIAVFPHVPGHELAGVVEEVGACVVRWQVGDLVTSPFVCGCGTCEWCLAGDAQVCPDQTQPGFTHHGSWAELVVLHAADANLVAVPDGVSPTAAASLGCRFATAYRAMAHRARVAPGEWVAVVGAGGVGLSAVMVAAARGGRVVAVDRNPDALEAARQAGAEHTVLADGSASAEDVAARLRDLSDGGTHVSLDAVGSETTCATAVLGLRRRGRHVQVGLLPAGEGHPRVPMDRVIGFELDVLGSHGMSAAHYPEMLALVADGTLRPQDLVGQVVDLETAAGLVPGMRDAPRAGMTVLDPRR